LNIFSTAVLLLGKVGSQAFGRAMMGDGTQLETVSNRVTRRETIVGVAMTVGGLILGATGFQGESEREISRTAEVIHQETSFRASRKRVYEALTDAKQFDRVTYLSGAMKSTALGNKATEISSQAGGSFVLFGGHIIGRQIELVPNERIVQAWRVIDWEPGVYSIAKFALAGQDTGTRLVFDHTGFPKGLAEHLAAGWKAHYWEPLGKFLA
jgi:activator of HSP90 ATPase